MSDRTQPVCKGINKKGQLVWRFIPMARWQMAMFPIKYCGDFAAFWYKQFMLVTMGCEPHQDIPNASFSHRRFGKIRKERQNTGD